MFHSYKSAKLFILISVIFLVSWMVAFHDSAWWRMIGVSLISFLGGLVALQWTYRAFKSTKDSSRLFWLQLGLGILVYISGYVTSFLSLLLYNSMEPSVVSFTLWVIGYFFFLSSLLYKTKLTGISFFNNPQFFDIIVLMGAAVVISIYYLVEPIMRLTYNSFYITFLSLSSQIINLCILFFITYLYYLSRYSSRMERKVIHILVFSFMIHIIAVFGFSILALNNIYYLGSIFDLFWFLSMMIIGLTGTLAGSFSSRQSEWKIKEHVSGSETYIPYISTIILFIMVFKSYEWKYNVLSIGLTSIFFMIITRHRIIIKRNKTLMEKYRELAYHDPLTGLSNRTSFKTNLVTALEYAKSNETQVGILLLDLDRFKNVNDTLGHYVGDRLLKKAAGRLRSSLKTTDQIYRIGGDEFVIVLTESSSKECIETSEKIIEKFSKSFYIGNHEITVTPSIGISTYPQDGDSIHSLLKCADAAMYIAKEKGRNNYEFHDSDVNKVMSRNLYIENELRKAIERKQFSLYYQPIFHIDSGELFGMEALLRWNHPSLGSVSPTEFIPIAEDTGQIVSIGTWVTEQACKQTKVWHEMGFPTTVLSINVSPLQFEHRNFVHTIKTIIEQTGLDPPFLKLEITESIMKNVTTSTNVLNELREYGVKTAIDDFGTGYSSLYILKKMPIDTIKIDKSFIDDLEEHTSESMVKAIIEMGLNLNLTIVAEGVEKYCQLETLKKLNCTLGQGYYFQKPVSGKGFEQLLIRTKIRED
ncbi:putative bifunctional diguanylate cyclase/phosphodiesterase [Evansella tamaricis]|uniref:EAL domain-containing protein n=1 Tax=Evansella tamaricis TaxID=2069301 RepID=A0ABS6JHF9_9BACI|nr:EAL domain-containing protein [Evansella tamaricis]MBU9713067.1 EAL domain-containing protein [Evansella tamaricis]